MCVNGNRKLISCRQVKIDQLGSLLFGRDGGDASADRSPQPSEIEMNPDRFHTQSRAELRACARPPSEAHLQVADGTATGLAGPRDVVHGLHRNRLPSRQEPPGPSNDHRVERDPSSNGAYATPGRVPSDLMTRSHTHPWYIALHPKHTLYGAASRGISGRRVGPQIRSTAQQFLPIKFFRDSQNLQLVDLLLNGVSQTQSVRVMNCQGGLFYDVVVILQH